MAAETEERAPLFYARVAGFIYLFAMALSILSQMLIPDRIVVSGDAAATARNIVSFGGTFRLGIAIDVVIFASDVVIAWAFYELLKSVDRSLALLGAFLRVADGAILAVTAFSGLITLRLLSGADYLQAIPMNQLQALARLFMSVRGAGFYVASCFWAWGRPCLCTCCSGRVTFRGRWRAGESSHRWRWRLARSPSFSRHGSLPTRR